MLATVLTGIAAGSLLAAPFLKRGRHHCGDSGAARVAGIAALAGAQVHGSLYDPASAATGPHARHRDRRPADSALPRHGVSGRRPALVERRESAGRQLGVLYAGNVAGALVGSLLAGFVLLRTLGSARSLAVMAGVSPATGVRLLLGDIRRAPLISSVLAVSSIGLSLRSRVTRQTRSRPASPGAILRRPRLHA